MSPLVTDGSLVLVKKSILLKIKPSAGDLVVFPSPLDGELNIKRCSAVDDSSVFVTGVNLPESTDSRHFGRISIAELTGIVLLY
ncbi:MAG: S26 family signal peptidase [Spirochaetales bacterium]|nr:S26 family signal peptidase [Spirochaetales bacterium]